MLTIGTGIQTSLAPIGVFYVFSLSINLQISQRYQEGRADQTDLAFPGKWKRKTDSVKAVINPVTPDPFPDSHPFVTEIMRYTVDRQTNPRDNTLVTLS